MADSGQVALLLQAANDFGSGGSRRAARPCRPCGKCGAVIEQDGITTQIRKKMIIFFS